MNLLDFTDNDFEFGQTKRILVYPNITYLKNLEQDSYVQVMRNFINELGKIRNDIFWYIITPEFINSFDKKNVHQFIVPVPSYPPTMRMHFDVFKMLEHINNQYDFDLVFSHLPEHTLNLMNVLSCKTHFVPKVLGYCHWFDFDNIVSWPKPAFMYNVTGLLEMEHCYVNTEYQKQLVLTEAKKYFSDTVLLKLNGILKTYHLGVNDDNIVDTIDENPDKIIVFNHRPHAYKDFDSFMKAMDVLWSQRQDFKVWIPLLETPNREYVIVDKLRKEDYYKKLRKCLVGVSPKQKYGGWSVSTTDGLMNGCPFIMYDAPYYKELNKSADFFDSEKELLEVLDVYLDHTYYRNKKALEGLKHSHQELSNTTGIKVLSSKIDNIIFNSREIKTASDATKRIYQMIDDAGIISKKELMKQLRWGPSIKWNPYRNALMRRYGVKDVLNNKTPYYTIQ